ncbi:MAG: hypothetical protein AAGB05_17350 [Pseudomonadota bacterium]
MIPVGIGPASRGATEQGAATQQDNRQDAAAPVKEASISAEASSFKPETPDPVSPPQASSETSRASGNTALDTMIELAPKVETEEQEEAAPPPPEPAGPLKTYAQIPTEMVREISRLREEAAEEKVQGVPGRNDPTPMPASPDAIGTGRVPYDAA